jgi:hypothetical protein
VLYAPESQAAKIAFRERLIYVQINDNHVLAVGKTLLYVDPTLSRQELTAYARLFVRNKAYLVVPREGGKAHFKNMTGFKGEQSLQLFEEILLGQYKKTPETHFKTVFKECLLKLIRSLPLEQYESPAVQGMLEYLIPGRPQQLPVSETLLLRIRESGLEDRLPYKSYNELLSENVHPEVHKVYKVLKAANVPIFQARKHKLDSQNLSFRQKEGILERIKIEDKVRLYILALIIELYLSLKKRFPDLEENALDALAAHFYGLPLRRLPPGVKAFVQAHLELFQKWEKK